MEKPRAEDTVHSHGGREHDSEDVSRRGMSSDAAAADQAETMASTGDSENAFHEIAAGTATGWGIDRGESAGTGGLAAGEDLDEVAERSWDALHGENALSDQRDLTPFGDQIPCRYASCFLKF